MSVLEMLFRQRAKKKRILIVEPNAYHGELLPGFYHLFCQLDYSVDILVRRKVIEEDPFCRVAASDTLKIIPYELDELAKLLGSGGVKKYDRIFFSTNVLWEREVNQSSIVDYLGFEPKAKKQSLFIEHNLTYLDEDNARNLLNEGRVFTLLPYKYDGLKTKMINPHHFGQINSIKNRDNGIKIVLLGSSSKDDVNLEALYYAVRNMKKAKLNHFKIIVLGFNIEVPSDLRDLFQIIGRVDFPAYYSTIEQCHYLLTLIDTASDDIIHTKYKNGTTSGTIQTSLGFIAPMIINSVHADAYGFSTDNSVVYDNNMLTEGLLNAITMSSDEYDEMRRALEKKANNIEVKSMENLKQALETSK